MEFLDTTLFRMTQRQWMPLLRMKKTDEVAIKIGISSYCGRFAFGQLTCLDLPFDDLADLAQKIDADRLNWDATYARDLATYLSILVTNDIPCTSWADFERTFDAYCQSWQSRFLISLFCEAVSKKGYRGCPLYYSELVARQGLLDEIDARGPDSAFAWMHARMLAKLADSRLSKKIQAEFQAGCRCKAYPYLVFGAPGLDAYNAFERLGGASRLLPPNVPAAARDEIYIFVIGGFSSVSRYLPEVLRSRIYSNLFDLGIKDIVHFGADTSIRISPLFAFLSSEIGHFVSAAALGYSPSGVPGEVWDRSWMNLHTMYSKLGNTDRELDYSNLLPGSPPEMAPCIHHPDADEAFFTGLRSKPDLYSFIGAITLSELLKRSDPEGGGFSST
jgi:hypothetical protein